MLCRNRTPPLCTSWASTRSIGSPESAAPRTEPLFHDLAVERVRVLSRWPTHAPAAHDVTAAAVLAHDAQLSFWDAMIIRSATELGCAVLWSEDLNVGQRIAGVEVRDPFVEWA